MDINKLCIICMAKYDTNGICPSCGGHDNDEPELSNYYLPYRTLLNNRYLTGKIISSTAFRISYLAFDIKTKIRVVIDEFFPKQIAKRTTLATDIQLNNEKNIAYFKYGVLKYMEESKKLLKIGNHPNVVSVIDVFKANNTAYKVRYHVEGVLLEDYVKINDGKLSMEKAMDIMQPLTNILEYCHGNRVLHLNIGIRNICITSSGKLKLFDFGTTEFAVASKFNYTKSIDQNKYTVYPPEFKNNVKNIGSWSDVYQLGGILLYLLTGELVNSKQTEQPLFIKELLIKHGVNYTESLLHILNKTICNQLDSRYQNIRSFKMDLFSSESSIPVINTQSSPSLPLAEYTNVQKTKEKKTTVLRNSKTNITNIVMMSIVLLFMIVVGVWGLAGKVNSMEQNKMVNLTNTYHKETILRLHGSNTIGAELSPALIRKFLYKKGANFVNQTFTNGTEEKMIEGIFHAEEKILQIEIKSHGSGTGFKSLNTEECDIAAASRPIKGKELKLLKAKYGNLTERASEHVIGVDGLAIIVNMQNPVQKLSIKQLADIFSGKLTDWSQVDKKYSGSIHIYARDNKSGTYDTFKSIVLGKKIKLAVSSKRYESNDELSKDVSNDPKGIGFCGLPSVRNSKAIALYQSGTKPIYPTNFTVSTEDYLLARRLFMYTPANSDNSYVKEFIEYVLSREGQKVVKEIGFIPLSIKALRAPILANMPSVYKDKMKGALRLSINFRFKPDSTVLDNRAVRDIGRLVSYLEDHLNSKGEIFLFGFSDGNRSVSKQRSEKRAKAVAAQLEMRGLFPSLTLGLGNRSLVADTDSSISQIKNQRVEIWIKK